MTNSAIALSSSANSDQNVVVLPQTGESVSLPHVLQNGVIRVVIQNNVKQLHLLFDGVHITKSESGADKMRRLGRADRGVKILSGHRVSLSEVLKELTLAGYKIYDVVKRENLDTKDDRRSYYSQSISFTPHREPDFQIPPTDCRLAANWLDEKLSDDAMWNIDVYLNPIFDGKGGYMPNQSELRLVVKERTVVRRGGKPVVDKKTAKVLRPSKALRLDGAVGVRFEALSNGGE